jgi:DMSO/TMAO reductase YedYZ molybdopterin-dependent catalytic subunit
VLQSAGVRPEGRHVLFEGADQCLTGSRSTGFARSVPLAAALDDGALIALMMNQAEAHTGYFQSNDYRLWIEESDPGCEIGPMRVMATIAAPRPNDIIAAGLTRVHGAAWTGNGTVSRVEVSTDGGARWDRARFNSDAEHGVWRLWEFWWTAAAGEHTLMARATDSSGATQPLTLPPNRKGYANNFVLPVRVEAQ